MKLYYCLDFHVKRVMTHNHLAEDLMEAFIFIGAVQHQETEMTLDFVFQTVLIDISIKSDAFLHIWSFSKSHNCDT